MSLHVELSESHNPAFETAQAEARSVEVEMQMADSLLFRLNENIRQTDEKLRALNETMRQADRAAASGDREARARYQQAVEQAVMLRRQLDDSQAKLGEAMSHLTLLSERRSAATDSLLAERAGRASLAAQPLLPYGVEVMSIEVKNVVNGSALTTKGLMIISVLPGSAAQGAGLRPGDMIETIDGRGQLGLHWREQLPRESGREATLGVLREGKRLVIRLRRAGP